jgi:hypothetical protein
MSNLPNNVERLQRIAMSMAESIADYRKRSSEDYAPAECEIDYVVCVYRTLAENDIKREVQP